MKEQNNSICTISTKFQAICLSCSRHDTGLLIKLRNCEHFVCKVCFEKRAFQISPFFLESDLPGVKCECGKEFGRDVVYSLFTKEEIAESHRKALEPFKF